MPTQEERLTALEQKTAAHIQEMDENFTIMVGVIRHQGQDIKRIFQRLETMDDSLSFVNQRLETMDENLGIVNQRLETMDESLSTFNQRLETANKRLETIGQSLHQLQTNFNEHTSLLTEILARLPKAP